jgi:hypothetical protein
MTPYGTIPSAAPTPLFPHPYAAAAAAAAAGVGGMSGMGGMGGMGSMGSMGGMGGMVPPGGMGILGGMVGGSGMVNDQHHSGGPGSVLLVNRLPIAENALTPDQLFMLFGVYGDVLRVKVCTHTYIHHVDRSIGLI